MVGAIVIVCVVSAFLGILAGEPAGAGGRGFLFGLLLGPFGVLVAVLMRPSPEAILEHERELAKLRAATDAIAGSGTVGQNHRADETTSASRA